MTARSPGEKLRRQRKRERERVAYEALMAPLRAAGKCCGNCKHFAKAHFPMERREHHCSMDSSFDGYTIVQATDLCQYHEGRAP